MKTERLVNLTLALLATKRFLKKSEIFRTVHGYDGNLEAMDRMFERDKDDLRSLGIVIEVGGLDQFFEDEAGYRILRSAYSLELPDLTPREVAYLSIAANLWKDSSLTPAAQSGIRKLRSLGIPASMELVTTIDYRYENPKSALFEITEAIEQRRYVQFDYQSGAIATRKLAPYRVLLWNGYWYLVGHDLNREDIRMFKISRIIGEIKAIGKKEAFQIPKDFDVRKVLPNSLGDALRVASVSIRKGEAVTLRLAGEFKSEGEHSDLYEFKVESIGFFLRNLVWYGDSVELIGPPDLREEFISLIDQGTR